MADREDVPFKKFDRFIYKNLPDFSGRHLDWAGWFELYQTAVGNTDLEPEVKLSYLKKRLDRNTCADIESYTSEDYDLVIGLLQTRFTSSANVIMQIESYVNSLPNLKVNPEAEGIRRTVEKLRAITKLFSKYASGGRNPGGKKPGSDAAKADGEPDPKASCRRCPGNLHQLILCPLLTPEERRRLALKAQLCFCCLEPGHRSQACFSRHNCSQCGDRHSQLLCVARTRKQPSQKGNQRPNRYGGVHSINAASAIEVQPLATSDSEEEEERDVSAEEDESEDDQLPYFIGEFGREDSHDREGDVAAIRALEIGKRYEGLL